MTDFRVSRLAVVGLGLIGGSIARGARARRIAGEIVGVSRNPMTLAQARASGAVDRCGTDVGEGVRATDLVVLCGPVGVLPALVQQAWPHLSAGAVLTDVGSVKGDVVGAAAGCPERPDVAFVGGHPIAGSERSGFAASDADLFEGRLVLLTESAATPRQAIARVSAFWEALGGQVRVLSVDAHDQGVAAISHLPHLAAYALVSAAEGEALALAGRGFSDTTRIAASAEGLWIDIFRGNRGPLLEALDRYHAILSKWETLIRNEDWGALEGELSRARELREKLA